MKLLGTTSRFEDGQQWPPGFRFHPTDEELVLYYLKRKICRRRLMLDIIGETDVYKWDPEELPGLSKLKNGDRQWFFFSPRDRKYPNGGRSNRATRHGYWKATGKDRTITCNSRSAGVKKTLVFYKGRAPTGERTDWVMHEYTLDEEELKRCQTAQDYYALYKVFKKSGPGPKNGEQYGAPFREEEWADDDNINVSFCADRENLVKEVNDIVSVDNTKANGNVEFPLTDLEEFMNQIPDEPVYVQPLAVSYSFPPIEAVGEEETESTLLSQPLTETNLQQKNIGPCPNRQQNHVLPSFEITQSTINDTSEVTSLPNFCDQNAPAAEEDFFEDFLEMDDLIGPEPTTENVQQPCESIPFEEFDGLCELDLYEDAAMFLRDMGPMNPEPVSQSYFNDAGNDMMLHGLSSCSNILENGVLNSDSLLNSLEVGPVAPVSHSYCGNLDNEMVNTLDYQLQSHQYDANQISNQMWMHNQQCNFVTSAEANQGAISPPTSGVIHDGSSANLPTGVDQNQNQNEISRDDDGGDSWLSSALWAFVESIPTTPASAAEKNALVNKAFERVSSFRKMGSIVRISTGDTSVAAGNPTATQKRAGSSSYYRGFFKCSILGVLCAVLWVLMGTSLNVLDRYISL